MYEVYREGHGESKRLVSYTSKKDAEECVQRLNEAWELVNRPDVTYKIKYVKPYYIYVIKCDGKYLLTTKTRHHARDYISVVKKYGVNVNKKFTITQINLNNVEVKLYDEA